MNYINVLEITSSEVKLLTGYFFENNIYVLNACESSEAHLECSKVVDEEKLIKVINELVKNNSEKLNIPIEEIYLGLNPRHLVVFKATDSDFNNNTNGRVSINSAANLTTKVARQGKQKYPDLDLISVSTDYYLINGCKYDFFPTDYEKSADSIYCEATCEMTDKDYINTFKNLLSKCQVRLVGTFSLLTCATRFIQSCDVNLKNYIYLDLNKCESSVAAVYHGQIINSSVFSFGTNDVIKALMDKYNISFERASDLLYTFGLQNNPGFDYQTEEGLTLQEINDTISETYKYLFSSISSFLSVTNQKNECGQLIVISGPESSIINLDSLISHFFKTKLLTFNPRNFGARNPRYTNLLSMIFYQAKIYVSKGDRPIDLTITRTGDIATEFGKKFIDEKL